MASSTPIPTDPPHSKTKREYLIEEILSSEKLYRDHLNTLRDFYIKPLREHAKQKNFGISEHQIRILFNNTETICNFHNMFLDEISAPSANIIEIFLKYSDFLKIYTSYCGNYERSLKCLHEMQRNAKFVSFVNATRKNPDTGHLHLVAFLNKPIQRIPQYSLLLETLKEYTPASHADREALDECASKILQITHFVNEAKHKLEKMRKLLQIQHQMGDSFLLVSPHRIFLRDADLQIIEGPKQRPKPFRFILFNDVLVWTTPNGGKFRGVRELHHLQTHVVSKESFVFALALEGHALVRVQCHSEAELNSWVHAIDTARDDLRESDKARTLQKQKSSIEIGSRTMPRPRRPGKGGRPPLPDSMLSSAPMPQRPATLGRRSRLKPRSSTLGSASVVVRLPHIFSQLSPRPRGRQRTNATEDGASLAYADNDNESSCSSRDSVLTSRSFFLRRSKKNSVSNQRHIDFSDDDDDIVGESRSRNGSRSRTRSRSRSESRSRSRSRSLSETRSSRSSTGSRSLSHSRNSSVSSIASTDDPLPLPSPTTQRNTNANRSKFLDSFASHVPFPSIRRGALRTRRSAVTSESNSSTSRLSSAPPTSRQRGPSAEGATHRKNQMSWASSRSSREAKDTGKDTAAAATGGGGKGANLRSRSLHSSSRSDSFIRRLRKKRSDKKAAAAAARDAGGASARRLPRSGNLPKLDSVRSLFGEDVTPSIAHPRRRGLASRPSAAADSDNVQYTIDEIFAPARKKKRRRRSHKRTDAAIYSLKEIFELASHANASSEVRDPLFSLARRGVGVSRKKLFGGKQTPDADANANAEETKERDASATGDSLSSTDPLSPAAAGQSSTSASSTPSTSHRHTPSMSTSRLRRISRAITRAATFSHSHSRQPSEEKSGGPSLFEQVTSGASSSRRSSVDSTTSGASGGPRGRKRSRTSIEVAAATRASDAAALEGPLAMSDSDDEDDEAEKPKHLRRTSFSLPPHPDLGVRSQSQTAPSLSGTSPTAVASTPGPRRPPKGILKPSRIGSARKANERRTYRSAAQVVPQNLQDLFGADSTAVSLSRSTSHASPLPHRALPRTAHVTSRTPRTRDHASSAPDRRHRRQVRTPPPQRARAATRRPPVAASIGRPRGGASDALLQLRRAHTVAGGGGASSRLRGRHQRSSSETPPRTHRATSSPARASKYGRGATRAASRGSFSSSLERLKAKPAFSPRTSSTTEADTPPIVHAPPAAPLNRIREAASSPTARKLIAPYSPPPSKPLPATPSDTDSPPAAKPLRLRSRSRSFENPEMQSILNRNSLGDKSGVSEEVLARLESEVRLASDEDIAVFLQAEDSTPSTSRNSLPRRSRGSGGGGGNSLRRTRMAAAATASPKKKEALVAPDSLEYPEPGTPPHRLPKVHPSSGGPYPTPPSIKRRKSSLPLASEMLADAPRDDAAAVEGAPNAPANASFLLASPTVPTSSAVGLSGHAFSTETPTPILLSEINHLTTLCTQYNLQNDKLLRELKKWKSEAISLRRQMAALAPLSSPPPGSMGSRRASSLDPRVRVRVTLPGEDDGEVEVDGEDDKLPAEFASACTRFTPNVFQPTRCRICQNHLAEHANEIGTASVGVAHVGVGAAATVRSRGSSTSSSSSPSALASSVAKAKSAKVASNTITVAQLARMRALSEHGRSLSSSKAASRTLPLIRRV